MKDYLIIVLIALTSVVAKAQSRFKTNESIASQIKNGTAPGLVFSTSAVAKKEPLAEPVRSGSLGKQIHSNTVPGMLYQRTSVTEKSYTESTIQSAPNLPATINKDAELRKSIEKQAPPKSVQ